MKDSFETLYTSYSNISLKGNYNPGERFFNLDFFLKCIYKKQWACVFFRVGLYGWWTFHAVAYFITDEDVTFSALFFNTFQIQLFLKSSISSAATS